MIVNARYTAPCADCGAASDELCDETCLSRSFPAPLVVPSPRAALLEPHRVREDEAVGDTPTELTRGRELPTMTSGWLGEREGLGAREGAILALIVLGLSNQEIADALHISMRSTKTHVRSAYRKMGVTSRTQAISWGVHHGFQLTAPAARLHERGQP